MLTSLRIKGKIAGLQPSVLSPVGGDKESGRSAQKFNESSKKALPAQSAAGDQQGTAAAASAAAGGAVALQSKAGSRKQSKRGRIDEDSQTEYTVIPPKAKKRSRDLLTEHQREVAYRQRQGRLLLR